MKLQKIMLDAGFTCPNRDGHVARGGCTFCRTESFNPEYCRRHSTIAEQLEAGKAFFRGKYSQMQYLAYFQAYTSTYAPIEELRAKYDEALAVPDVVGLVISTRPDCIDENVLSLLDSIRQRGYMVTLELGIETFYERTLQCINRGHTPEQSIHAIRLCHQYGLPVTVHLMLGLPGETREDILHETEIINSLPITSLKLHQLQILRSTRMAEQWQSRPEDFLHFTLDSYTQLVVDFVRRLRPDIHVERYAASAPTDLLLAPRFGVKPAEVERRVSEILRGA